MKKSNLDVLVIMFGFTFFSGSMLIGQQLSSGLNFKDFWMCILIGGVILGVFGGMLGYIGVKTNKNMKDLSCEAFGRNGSYLSSILIGVTQIGWYGVGISMFAVPVANLILPNNLLVLYLVIILFGFLMTLSTFIGIKSITRISYIAVCTILIFGFAAIIYAATKQSVSLLDTFGNKDKINFITGLEMVIGSYISGAITTPNFSKHGKSGRMVAIICFLAFFVGNSLMFVFGAASNVLVGGKDIFDIFTYFGFSFLGVIVLGLNIWSSCDNGLYSAGLELENIFKINHKKIILFFGLFSTFISYYLYNNFIGFLSIINHILPPIGVVLIINYFVKVDNSSKRIDIVNCLAIIIGGITSLVIDFGISAINAIIVTGVVFLFGNIFNKKNKRMEEIG